MIRLSGCSESESESGCCLVQVNSHPMCMSPLLRSELRERLNFSGYICSDGDALSFDYHCPRGQQGHCCCNGSAVVAAATALHASVDINSGSTYSGHLGQALASGLIRETQLDSALVCVFTQRFGEFWPRLTHDHTVYRPSFLSLSS